MAFGSSTTTGTQGFGGGSYTYVVGGFITSSPTPSSPAPTAAAVSTSTGVNPVETSYSLYGHIVPISIFGIGRIGGEIISGPWIENGMASFIISFGVPADPSGTRTLREIAFDSEVVWNSSTGFNTESFTYRFYGGTLSQSADSLETSHFGSDAVAYRPQILIAIDNLPLANTKFKKIPYVSAVIADSTGDDVNLGEAFERLAYSPWVGYTSSQFETSGITDGVASGGLIFADQAGFLDTIQQFARFYPTWSIVQTDKLRITDRGSNVTADVTLNRSRLIDSVKITRQEPNSAPANLELTTIDPDADYTLVPSLARSPRMPVAVSASVTTDTAYLPIIMDSATRASVVTFTKYHEDQTRKTVNFKAMAYGLELEPGDYVALTDLGDDFFDEVFRVTETLHGANYVVEGTAESILDCTVETTDPHFGNVVLLMGFEGADGATGSPGFTDESNSAHGTASVSGGAQIDTAQAKFGASSYLNDGASDGIQFPWTSDFVLAQNPGDEFTIEAWVRPNTTSPKNTVIAGVGGVIGSDSWLFWCNNTGNGELSFLGSSNLAAFNWTEIKSSGLTWTSGQWYHVAADRDASNNLRVYRNGVMVASGNTGLETMTFNLPLAVIGIGCDSHTPVGTSSRCWNGWIDEIRITKGFARYASDTGFTPPTAAFPRS